MSIQKNKNIAIVGATGLVGRTILEILAEREFPYETIYALASENSIGKTVNCGDDNILVESLADFDFNKVDIAFFTAGSAVSEKYAPIAAACGVKVIDNTSFFRYHDDVPLVVSEVNGDILKNNSSNIIANPNCSTMQLMVALKPLYDAVGISRVIVSTYQSVSGVGQKGIAELADQTADLLNGREFSNQVFGKQIAFNAIPHIDSFQDNGYTKEEMKIVWETKKILGDDSIKVTATAVRVPIFFGHSEAVTIETRKKISEVRARELLLKAPGIIVMDDVKDNIYPTPAQDLDHQDAVFIGRIRKDLAFKNGLSFWVVGDNIRKGAALNSVQIAELLL